MFELIHHSTHGIAQLQSSQSPIQKVIGRNVAFFILRDINLNILGQEIILTYNITNEPSSTHVNLKLK